jgi:hypothetical protein
LRQRKKVTTPSTVDSANASAPQAAES